MVSQEPPIHLWEHANVAAAQRAARKVRSVVAAAIVTAFSLTLSTAARSATITVNSLADLGAPGICALRDAITAANSHKKVNGCKAGNGQDTINFSISGTIRLADTLPEITDTQLTINGLTPNNDSVTVDGGSNVQVMRVSSGATVNLKNLAIANGLGDDGGHF